MILRRATRPLGTRLGFLAVLAVYLPAALAVDARGPHRAQYAVAALTWILLGAALVAATAIERRQVVLAVVVATCFEVAFAIVWGLYRYRYDNLPMYVPPGHGLIYLSALRLSGTRPIAARPWRAARLVAVVASAWVVGGLVLADRPDVAGAILLPWLLFCLLRTPRAPVYVGAFVATTVLELLGTGLGNWRWAELAPGTPIGVGNPPSAIAGGYCLLDAIVLALAGLRLPWRRPSLAPGARAAAAPPLPDQA